MAADVDHARIVERLGDTHEERMYAVLQELEEKIAALVVSSPTKDGRLFDLAWAVQSRAQIQQIMRESYLTQADAIVREYDQVVESLGVMYSQYDSFVGVDNEIIANLKRVSFQGFEDIAITFSDDIANELYQNTLTGRPIDESIKNIRQKINGVYIQSNQSEIQRLVDIAVSDSPEAEEAVRTLHQIYAADRVGNNMRRYASQMIHDSLMQFDASINVAAGKEAGAEKWKYYGSVIRDSRDWCKRHAGKTYTEDQIRTMWSENSWAGKASGDPFIVRGGYNCRHHWRPVFNTET